MDRKTLIRSLDALILPMGFHRRKLTWNRRSDPFVDVMDLQFRDGGHSLTINAGILEKEAFRICWGVELPDLIEEPFCTVRSRIGKLIDGKDHWWILTEPGIDTELRNQVVKVVIPFFESMHSIGAISKHLENVNASQGYPPESIYFAALQAKMGNLNAAEAIMRRLGDRPIGAWKERVVQATARMLKTDQ